MIWGNVNFDYAFSSARGRSGGMLSVWDNSIFVKRHISCLNNFVVVEGEWVILGLKCFMVNVYAPQDEMEKRVLWQLLLSFINNNPGHYFIMGDFNAVRFEHERMGTTFSNRVVNYFNDFISEASLIDIPLGGFYFTRVDKTGKKLSKLDRFLLSTDLISRLPDMEAIALDLSIADHRPILLRQGKLNFGPIPFKFFNSWMEKDGFEKLVIEDWKVKPVVRSSNGFIVFKEKLKKLKMAIRGWGVDQVKKEEAILVNFSNPLDDIDKLVDMGAGSEELHNERRRILKEKRKLEHAKMLDESQKAKVKWCV
ncbi:uncharacterized protein LOC143613388 [Bidens hawaiensis]|uniref:uncharacterized protein LOC143613388 n=1 Tax=Bidens hawaiensis TaxID=980011 RepID=UPI00404A6F00